MEKIKMLHPIVEMDGDEMTRVIWQLIKEELILPYVDLKTEYYDLSLTHRDDTDDQVTVDAALAIKKHHVGVKCATITTNAQRVEEYHLKHIHPSPNGTIRGILDGTIFRTPIMIPGINPMVKSWKKPITVARHSFGDIFNGIEYHVEEAGKAELVFTNSQGKELYRKAVNDFTDHGVVQTIYNREPSIRAFAHACFKYALSLKQDLWFSTKDTVNKIYDGAFKDIFQEIYESDYKKAFEESGIKYFYTLIDDAVARTIRSEGGYIWALKNYDGDVMSDLISSGFGSLALMTSVLVSAEGNYEYEAAHGTIPRHYYRYLKGEKPSSNPVATIFAWTGALKKRGELDGTPDLSAFAEKIEAACLKTIASGTVTGDLVSLLEGVSATKVDTWEFMHAVRSTLETM